MLLLQSIQFLISNVYGFLGSIEYEDYFVIFRTFCYLFGGSRRKDTKTILR